MSPVIQLTYNPAIFDVPDIATAKRIILTPEGVPTELRWQVETPYVAELIAQTQAEYQEARSAATRFKGTPSRSRGRRRNAKG